MNHSFRHFSRVTGFTMFTLGLLLTGCSGSGMVAGSSSGGSGSPSTSSQSGSTDETTNIVTDSGDMISQGDLPDMLNSITSGSGEVLVNLGDAVSTLGNGLIFDADLLDENYLSNAVEAVAQTTTKLGTTVVSAGDAVAQLDVLPVFVQLNDGTGLLTYAGGTVAELGGVVENVGGWLEYHTSDANGALYGLTHQLSAMTLPIVVQTADMLDVKGKALVLFADAEDMKHSLPQFLFLTKSELIEGTRALLVDQKGWVANLGTLFVGDHGLLAMLFDGVGSEASLLRSLDGKLDSGLISGLTSQQSAFLNLLNVDASLGVFAEISGSLALVTQNLSALLDVNADVDGQLSINRLLGEHAVVTHTLASTLGGVTYATSSLVSEVLGTTTGVVGGVTTKVLDTSRLHVMHTENTNSSLSQLLSSESTEQHSGLLESLNSNLLSPLLNKGL